MWQVADTAWINLPSAYHLADGLARASNDAVARRNVGRTVGPERRKQRLIRSPMGTAADCGVLLETLGRRAFGVNRWGSKRVGQGFDPRRSDRRGSAAVPPVIPTAESGADVGDASTADRSDPSDGERRPPSRSIVDQRAVLDRFDVEVFAGRTPRSADTVRGRRAIDSGRVTLPTDEEEFAVVGTAAIGTAVGRRAQ